MLGWQETPVDGATSAGADGLFETAVEFGISLLPAALVLIVFSVVLGTLHRFLPRSTPGNPFAGFRRQLTMLAVTALGALVLLLALPLSGERLNGILTLIGLVVSAAIALAATTFVSNAMAGVMMRAVRNFKIGDYLQVGEHSGRVTERELFHTEIQTEDRDLLTLPNLFLVTNPVKVIRPTGTVLSASVSLGYDVPRDRVERLLLQAARKAGLEDPFVQILELLDHAVVYRAAGLLKDVKQLLSARSRLHGELLDALHADGVEIVSPSFVNQRVAPHTETQPVIPTHPTAAPGDGGSTPESVAFDKAEQVEDLAELRRAYAGAETRLAELQAQDDEAGTAAETLRLTGLLESLRRRIERHESRLEKDHS